MTILGITAAKAIVALLAFRHPPTWEDGQMAASFLAQGSLFVEHFGQANHTMQFPMYALLMTGVYSVFGIHPQLMVLVNLGLSVVAAWVLVEVFQHLVVQLDRSRSLGTRQPAIVYLAVVAFLLHPFISYYTMNNLHPLILDLLVFYLMVRGVLRYMASDGGRPELWWLALVSGLALLTRTTLIVALLPFVWWTVRRFGVGVAVARLALILAIGLLVGAPWLIRNYRVERVIGYTSSTGEILWKGTLEGADGNYLANGQTYETALLPQERRQLTNMTVRDQSAFFFRKYLSILRERPAQAARQYLQKLRSFYWFRPGMGIEYGAAIRRVMPIYQIGYAVMLSGGLLALAVFRRKALTPWLLIAGFGLLQAVFYVETRHRVLIEPLLILLSLSVLFAVAECSREAAAADRLTPEH